MQTRIKKTTTVEEGVIKFTPQWRKSWYSEWYGFYIHTNSDLSFNDWIVNSYPCKFFSDRVRKLEMAKEVIDNFLKNPITEDKVEYIKYP